MTPAPKRRWFRFSLATLFVVVTLLGSWLGWNVRTVRQRRDMIESIEHRGGTLFLVGDRSRYKEAPEVPLVRQWLGDVAVSQIVPPKSGSVEEDEQIRAAFPEAYVYFRVLP